MNRLIIINPKGDQEILELGPGGKYFDEAKILWDESKDGPITKEVEAKLGGITRVGNTLVIDDVKATEQAQKEEAARQAVLQKENDQASRRVRLKLFSSAKDLDEMNAIVKDLIGEMLHL